MIRKAVFIAVLLSPFWQITEAQVLISLLLGDKLNSDKLKFGLDGGVNFSDITNTGPSKPQTNYNLGFYFDFLLKEKKNWYIHTGVLVKSSFGTNKLSPYPLNNPELDTLFSSGFVNRDLQYFNVPILIRYKSKREIYIELGPMLGLLYKANDVFTASVNTQDDMTYTNQIRDQYKHIDIGIDAGIGYLLQKGNGISFGIRYYQGLRNILKQTLEKPQYNSNLYLYVCIPIGAGEKAKAKKAASAKKREDKKAKKEDERKKYN